MVNKVWKWFQKTVQGSSLALGMLVFAICVAGLTSAEAATATAALSTNHWKSGSTQGYTLNAVVTVPASAGLADVTISGAQISSTLLSLDTGGTVYTASLPLATRPTVGALYAISVVYKNTAIATDNFSLPVSAVLDTFATPVAPLGAVGANNAPTFVWSAPATLPTGFANYTLSLSGADIQWDMTQNDPQVTSAQYNNSLDPTQPATTTAGLLYNWSLFVTDTNGNSAEVRSSFMPGANFAGKVTDMGGNGIAGVTVNVLDSSFKQQPLSATTLSDGSYLYGGLPTGSYLVEFVNSTYHFFYSNKMLTEAPDSLQVTSGTVISGVNAVFGVWGALTGSVFNYNPSASGVQITAYDSNKVLLPAIPVLNILTDGSTFGFYEMSALPVGSYNIKFSAPGVVDVWVPVTVAAGVVTPDISASLTSYIPKVTGFTVPTSSNSLTVSVSMTAAELFGVAGYMVTESATAPAAGAAGWSPSAPTSYTFSSGGVKNLYAWAKGSTGLVSVASATAHASVTVNVLVNGLCGASNAASLFSAPTTGLCTTGSASAVAGSGPWTWTCDGANGGSTANCSAQLLTGAATFPMALVQGWNMISLPLQPSPTTVGSVLGALNYRNLWGFSGSWQMYDPSNLDASDLTDLKSGAGYWIYANAPATVQLVGTAAAKSMPLALGWNFVGYSGTVALGVVQATNGIAGSIDTVWSFNAGAWQLYDPTNLDASDLATLVPGKGYWIKMKQAGTWTLP
jgi:hypothetical protein